LETHQRREVASFGVPFCIIILFTADHRSLPPKSAESLADKIKDEVQQATVTVIELSRG